MRKSERLWVGAAAVLVAAVAGDSQAQAGGRIKKTVEQCSNAYAILGWAPGPDDKVWEKMGWVMYTRPHWKIAEQHERGVVQQASFRQYGVKGAPGAVAFVAHCGHGGTCNAIAESFFKWYGRVGVPAVYCGPLPRLLENPSTPTIPKPDLTDYYKPSSIAEDLSDEPSIDDFF